MRAPVWEATFQESDYKTKRACERPTLTESHSARAETTIAPKNIPAVTEIPRKQRSGESWAYPSGGLRALDCRPGFSGHISSRIRAPRSSTGKAPRCGHFGEGARCGLDLSGPRGAQQLTRPTLHSMPAVKHGSSQYDRLHGTPGPGAAGRRALAWRQRQRRQGAARRKLDRAGLCRLWQQGTEGGPFFAGALSACLQRHPKPSNTTRFWQSPGRGLQGRSELPKQRSQESHRKLCIWPELRWIVQFQHQRG